MVHRKATRCNFLGGQGHFSESGSGSQSWLLLSSQEVPSKMVEHEDEIVVTAVSEMAQWNKKSIATAYTADYKNVSQHKDDKTCG